MKTALALITLAGLAAVGVTRGNQAAGEPGGDAQESSPDSVLVEIVTFQYQPDTLRIKEGTVVVWVNRDAIEHTVTSDGLDEAGEVLDLVLKEAGAFAAVGAPEAGTYPYLCARHPFMRGVLIVEPSE